MSYERPAEGMAVIEIGDTVNKQIAGCYDFKGACRRWRILVGQLLPGRSITGAVGSACAGTRFPTAQTGNGHTGEPEQLFHISWHFLHLISAGR